MKLINGAAAQESMAVFGAVPASFHSIGFAVVFTARTAMPTLTLIPAGCYSSVVGLRSGLNMRPANSEFSIPACRMLPIGDEVGPGHLTLASHLLPPSRMSASDEIRQLPGRIAIVAKNSQR